MVLLMSLFVLGAFLIAASGPPKWAMAKPKSGRIKAVMPAQLLKCMNQNVPEVLDMRTFDVEVILNKVTATVVLHKSVVTSQITRLILFTTADGKVRSEKLEKAAAGDFNACITSTTAEAKELGLQIFGKKKKSKQRKHQSSHSQRHLNMPEPPVMESPPPITEADLPPAQMEEDYHPPVEQPTIAQHAEENPIKKGFISMFEGRLVSAKVEDHLKVNGDKKGEKYSSFTVTLDTRDGPEKIQGNDLSRAIETAGLKPGDQVRIFHLRSTSFGNGKSKKIFAATKVRANSI
jgi:hypothetical protein